MKIFKIIFINLLIFLALFGVFEVFCYFYVKQDAQSFMNNYNKEAKDKNQSLMTVKYGKIKPISEDKFTNWRKTNMGDKNKPSILFFGCSYIYGWYVDENETIPYLVTKYTGRTTVNRGVPGGCIMNMFDDLNSSDFLTQAKSLPKPDYIIYLWINDHLNRISRFYESPCIRENENFYELYPEWSYKNGKLIKTFPPKWTYPFYSLFSVKAYYLFLSQNFAEKKDEKMLRYFKMAKNQCKKDFPNARFVVIQYIDCSRKLMSEKLKRNLENEGISVLNAEDLAGHELVSDEWRTIDKEHPNGKAFEDITKGLVKELNL